MSIRVECECGEELEIEYSDDYYGDHRIIVKAHKCEIISQKEDLERDSGT